MPREISLRVWSSSDWEDEIVAAVIRVGERPVIVVAGVPGPLELERQHSGVERYGRVQHVLRRVRCGLRIQRPSPAEHTQ